MPLIDKRDFLIFKKDCEHIVGVNKICAADSGSLYEWSYYLRGREQIYFDFYDNQKIADTIIFKVAEFVDYLTFKNIEAGADILCFYDDLGSQKGLQISPAIFKRFYKPHYKKIWQKIKSEFPNKLIFLHSCGDISEIIPDLIECGLDILHPIQLETMDVYKMNEIYGRGLIFWGTISNQKTFPFGGRNDIFSEVKERINLIGKENSLIISPSNIIGKDVPIKNIMYFIEACKKFTNLIT